MIVAQILSWIIWKFDMSSSPNYVDSDRHVEPYGLFVDLDFDEVQNRYVHRILYMGLPIIMQ